MWRTCSSGVDADVTGPADDVTLADDVTVTSLVLGGAVTGGGGLMSKVWNMYSLLGGATVDGVLVTPYCCAKLCIFSCNANNNKTSLM